MSEVNQILHVMPCDKFIFPFIDFLEQNFSGFDRHLFFISGDEANFPVQRRTNVRLASDFHKPRNAYFELAFQMNHAERIILHGLFNIRVVQLLALQPWLLKKCYWVIWGGDLYRYKLDEQNTDWQKNEFFRRFVIKRLGHLVTYIRGDIDLARQWYGACGKHHECLMYPSNLYKEYPIAPKEESTINIQIGNSADPSNEHLEILKMLEPFRDENIRIFAPLSYSDPEHGQRVAKAGEQLFGDKFIPLTKFMEPEEYLEFLGNIGIAIFNHRRQQGMGNIITLLGLGKKVYLRTDVTSWGFFQNIGAIVYDIDNIDLHPLSKSSILHNKKIIKNKFSKNNLIIQLKQFIEG